MTAHLQRPGGGEHEQGGMRVEHRFLQLDRAQAERIAHHDDGKLRDHDVEAAPGSRAPDRRGAAIDTGCDGLGEALNAATHDRCGVRHFGACDRSLRRSIMGNIGRREPARRRLATNCKILGNAGTTAMTHDHHDDHDHDHDHGSELSEMQLRVRALETVLAEKGYIDPAALDAIIEAYETKVGPHTGARVVAKAWSDPAFKQALLADASKAVASFGLLNRVGDHLLAVENTPKRHNMIVCTLCSCYPWEVLGLPPVWYKSAPYRSRTVNDPRGVLADFGVTLPSETEVRVWDSTAETRFIVLPMRPAGTEGWSEEKLAALVTRDSMIGTGLAKNPKEAA